jgi:hypothetical protein
MNRRRLDARDRCRRHRLAGLRQARHSTNVLSRATLLELDQHLRALDARRRAAW